MPWNDIVENVTALCVWTAADPEIANVEYDSRRVRPGSLFVAMRGGTADGNHFIDAALAQGAVAIVTDNADTAANVEARGVPCALVEHGRRALAEASAALFQHPERKLKISAITGTNGKTTTAWLLEQLLTAAGRNCLLIGTVETRIAGRVLPSEHTTPEASDLYALFAQAVAAGCTEVVMEMSSHALAQERVWGVPVDVALFTNLTQDHLDFHGSVEEYARAKGRLFHGVGAPPPRVAIINEEADFAAAMLDASGGAQDVIRYATAAVAGANHVAQDLQLHLGDTRFTFVTPRGSTAIHSPLTGRINVENLLAAMCAALARGLSLEQIASLTPLLCPAPGRFELVPASRDAGFTVIVDYAHTDDALRNLIAIARSTLAGSDGRILTVFGCGGDRDRTKRPRMALAAGDGSDIVVVTSDNPRSEDPAAIIREILPGFRSTAAHILVEEDRETAIAAAIGAAHPGDIVLIAGKGHEKVQIIGDQSFPFDDVAVASRILHQSRKEESA